MSYVQQLEDRVAELEDAMGLTAKIPRSLFPREMFNGKGGFSFNRVSEILGILIRREFADRNAVFDCMYGHQPEVSQPPIKILDVYISHARKMLRCHGIEIETIWGRGWCVSPANKAKLREVIAEHESRRAAA